jgi:hypothetical protein
MIVALKREIHPLAIEFTTGTNFEISVYEAHLEVRPNVKIVVTFDSAPSQAQGPESDAGRDVEHARRDQRQIRSVAAMDPQVVAILIQHAESLIPANTEVEIFGITTTALAVMRIDFTPEAVTFFFDQH